MKYDAFWLTFFSSTALGSCIGGSTLMDTHAHFWVGVMLVCIGAVLFFFFLAYLVGAALKSKA